MIIISSSNRSIIIIIIIITIIMFSYCYDVVLVCPWHVHRHHDHCRQQLPSLSWLSSWLWSWLLWFSSLWAVGTITVSFWLLCSLLTPSSSSSCFFFGMMMFIIMFFFYFLLIRVFFFFFFFVIIMNLRNILLLYVNHIMSIHIASYRLCLSDVCLDHIATCPPSSHLRHLLITAGEHHGRADAGRSWNRDGFQGSRNWNWGGHGKGM